MTPQEFNELVASLSLNFGFKIEGPGSDKWCELLFETASKFSEKDIAYGIKEMFKMTNKQWSQEYKVVYGRPPAIAVWIEFFRLRQKHEIIALKDAEYTKALEDAKNGIEPIKKIEVDNSIKAEKIEALISKLGNYQD